MPDETHKLQKDPPEGSRKVIEHELERQAEKGPGGNNGQPPKDQRKPGGPSEREETPGG